MWLSNLGRRSLDPVFEKVDNPEAEFAEWLMQLGLMQLRAIPSRDVASSLVPTRLIPQRSGVASPECERRNPSHLG